MPERYAESMALMASPNENASHPRQSATIAPFLPV